MTISRGQTPRQLYGLGSFIKKITRPVKKVVSKAKDFAKSDLGKAAILGIGAFGLPTAAGQKIFSGFAPQFLKTAATGLMDSKLGGVLKDVAVGTGVAGLTDYFTKPKLDPAQQRIMGRTQEELNELEKELRTNYKNLGYTEGEIDLLVEQNMKEYSGRAINAYGGRIGYSNGSEDYERRFMELVSELREAGFSQQEAIEEARERLSKDMADGGRIGYAMGDTAEDNAMQASGIMGLPLNENPAGVTELDLRNTGGFIPPVGVKEKADDIPAMLSNNEFVFTADAVRGMGDGDVNKGAERMYSMMKQLENGGRV
tara:strand:+ start:2971 stop:3912 length:942 start_codon:yes stop_codon:yes gene_type:complete